MKPSTAYPLDTRARHGEAVVLTLADDARRALTRRFGEEAPVRLARCLGASEAGDDILLLSDARELLSRARGGRRGWFVRPCPRWRHATGGHHPADCFSAPRAVDGGCIAVVGCPLRRAELLRQGGFLRVLTVREASCALVQSGLLPQAEDEPVRDDTHMQRLLFEARRLAGDPSQEPLFFTSVEDRGGVWEATGTLEGRPIRFARAGSRAADALMEEMLRGVCVYDVIEVLGCAGGC